MVSKNNTQLLAKRLTEREVPHYSLRKLGIGVVSVLLGTTMYFGANSTVANADTVSASGNNESDTPAGTTEAAKNTEIQASQVALTSNSQTGSSVSSAVSQQPVASTSSQSSQASAVSATTNQSSATGSSKTSQAASASAGVAKSTATQNFNVPKSNVVNDNAEQIVSDNKVEQNKGVSVSLSDGSSLQVADNKLSSLKTSTITFKTSTMKANDKYIIRIPLKYTQNITTDDLQTPYGKRTTYQDNDYFYMEDTFRNSGTISQTISLSGKYLLDFVLLNKADSIYPGEVFNFNVSIKKNDGDWKELPFTYQIPKEVTGNLLVGPTRIVYTKMLYPHEMVQSESQTQILGKIPVHNHQKIQYQLSLLNYGLEGTADTDKGSNTVKNYVFNGYNAL